jgi:hypothetical protein
MNAKSRVAREDDADVDGVKIPLHKLLNGYLLHAVQPWKSPLPRKKRVSLEVAWRKPPEAV